MAGVETELQHDVAAMRDIAAMPDADTLFRSTPSAAPAAMGYLVSLAMTAVATFVAVGIDSGVTIPNVSLVFVVPVIIAGMVFDLGASVLSAILGALAYNFFLTEPRYTLFVDDAANIWAISLLFVVGLIVSSIAYTSRRRKSDAARLKRQVSTLDDYGRDIVSADDNKAILAIAARALAALFQVPAVVMLVNDGEVTAVNRVGELEPQTADFEAARSSLETGVVARAGIYPVLASRFDFWPIATATGQSAVIGLAFGRDERPATPDPLIDLVGNLLALALDRLHLRAGREI
jgi:two-component system sensor histidine kinase KdpD